jgi:glutamate decarboxylase
MDKKRKIGQDSISQQATEIEALREEVKRLKEAQHQTSYSYYASHLSQENSESCTKFPQTGMPAAYCKRSIEDVHELDSKEKLNTSSYVNVTFEPEEEEVAVMGLKVNLADQTVYPAAFDLHDQVVNKLASLWNCPDDCRVKNGVSAGAGCVGSTEACLLAALALKFRWRKWYQKKHNLSDSQVRGVYPNLVISNLYQACWEKFFRYMDVEPRLVKSSVDTFTVTADAVRDAIDDKTIGVVAIMGNHYGGQYDPVWDISDMLTKLNTERGLQVGIHVDAASGGFIAPFQPSLPAWDFRLPNVLSISSSGHKFGQSSCGTGWVVWRDRADLSEHVAVSVTYLGGVGDSYTLNFSRPATGVYVQHYKIARLGIEGYTDLCHNMMHNAKLIRDGLKAMTKRGKPLFIMLDHGDTECLPVVTAMLNPALELNYNDVDLQHTIAQDHWYVSAYSMSFNHPITEVNESLFTDAEKDRTMFRVVVKANLSTYLATHLLKSVTDAIKCMDEIFTRPEHKGKHGSKHKMKHHPAKHTHC